MLFDVNVRRYYFNSNSGPSISRWSDLKAELLAVDVSRDYCLERGEVECNICRATTVDEVHRQGVNMVRMGSCGCVPIYCRDHLENWLKFSGGKCPFHLHIHGEMQNEVFPYHNDYISDEAARIILNGYFAVRGGMPRFGWETLTVRHLPLEALRNNGMSHHLSHLLGRTYKRSKLITQLVRLEKATLHPGTKRRSPSRQSLVRDATELVDEIARRDRQSSVSNKNRFCSELSKGRKYLKSYVQRMIRKGEALDKSFWLVDKILSHRRSMSEIEYKVKWLGLSEAGCTWQPESTICGETPDTTCAEEEIDSYYFRRVTSKKQRQAKKARTANQACDQSIFSIGTQAHLTGSVYALSPFFEGQKLKFPDQNYLPVEILIGLSGPVSSKLAIQDDFEQD